MFRSLFLGSLFVSLLGHLAFGEDAGAQGGLPAAPTGLQRLPEIEAPRLADPPVDVAQPGVEHFVREPQLEPVELWEGSFELGVNGTEGNTQTLNFRLGLDAKRETDTNVLDLDLDYRKDSNDGLETANRAFFDWRWKLRRAGSRWSPFVHGTVDYDEFQAFDARISVDGGMAYRLIDWETTSLEARAGGGFSREIGGPDDRYVPEAVFGLAFEHQVSKRQKLSLTAEYAPDVEDFGNYRLNTGANWEMLIDEEMGLSLKLGVLDRYDSTPNGVKPNDLDYSIVLLWRF